MLFRSAYRVQPCSPYGHFFGPFGRAINNYPIPMLTIPEKYREVVNSIYLRDSIGTVEAMLANADGSGSIRVVWPPDLIAIVGRDILEGYALADAWTSGSTAFLYEVLERVRNRVLQFVLEVKKMVGTVDDLKAENVADIKDPLNDKFQQIIVMGDNSGNIAGNQPHASVNVTNIKMGDFNTLKSELEKQGLDEELIQGLEKALSEDGDQKKEGGRVSQWIADFSAKVALGTLDKVSVQALPGILDAINQYFTG